MPDGSSGLSLSEIGISAVKKTAQVVKKVGGPVAKQVKQQLGGTFIPSQSSQAGSSQPPSEAIANIGGNDLNAMLGEKNVPAGAAKQVTQQMQTSQNTALFDQQKQQDQQQIESLRKKLHDMYFEEFKNKAEGRGGAQQQEEQKRLQAEQQDDEEKRRQKEQALEPIMMSQGPKKGFGKKVKTSLMNMIKPKQGSHEGKASKG